MFGSPYIDRKTYYPPTPYPSEVMIHYGRHIDTGGAYLATLGGTATGVFFGSLGGLLWDPTTTTTTAETAALLGIVGTLFAAATIALLETESEPQ